MTSILCKSLVQCIVQQGLGCCGCSREIEGVKRDEDASRVHCCILLRIHDRGVMHVREDVLKQSDVLAQALAHGTRESSTRVVDLDPAFDVASVRLVFGSLSAGHHLFDYYTGDAKSLFDCVLLMEQYMVTESFIVSAVKCCCKRIAELDPETWYNMLVSLDRIARLSEVSSRRLLPLRNACAKSLSQVDEARLTELLRNHEVPLPVHLLEVVLNFVQEDTGIFEYEACPTNIPAVFEAALGEDICTCSLALDPPKGLVMLGSVSTAVGVTMKVIFRNPLIGRRINVLWNVNWYSGAVTAYNSGDGKHKVEYDDGDIRWYRMCDKKWQLCPSSSNPFSYEGHVKYLAGIPPVVSSCILCPQNTQLIAPCLHPALLETVNIRFARRAVDVRLSLTLAWLCPEGERNVSLQTLFDRYRERLLLDNALDAEGLWRGSSVSKLVQRWALLNRTPSLQCYSNEDIKHTAEKVYPSPDFEDYPLRLRFFDAVLNCALVQLESQEEKESAERAKVALDAVSVCSPSIQKWGSEDIKELVSRLPSPSQGTWYRIPVLKCVAERLYDRLTRSDRIELIFSRRDKQDRAYVASCNAA
jgi:hypothetical protein